MDFTFNGRRLHLPLELITHICSFLESTSDACAARLTNRVFDAAATPLITDVWNSRSILFVKPNLSANSRPYNGIEIDPNNRPRWVEKPITIWTWLIIPAGIPLENGESIVGKEFVRLLCAPDEDLSDYARHSFEQYGRKAVSWGRMQESPDLFCIITQWDCQHSLDIYRGSNEAQCLRTFLDEVAPGCISSSTSEYTPIAAHCMRCRPLFEGFYEIRTIYFKRGSTKQQKEEFDKTNHLYRHRQMMAVAQHLGLSPWWWLPGMRNSCGMTTVAARFAFFWKSKEIEETHQATRTRLLFAAGPDEPERRVVDVFNEELQAAGAVGTTSLHCNFNSGPWRN